MPVNMLRMAGVAVLALILISIFVSFGLLEPGPEVMVFLIFALGSFVIADLYRQRRMGGE
ncbi:hypothetical protein [Natronocalculus amylovorans]|uniref:Uncharacterized protein n=1 Tax=Natronocalculus amylovorans TaxID=2917812 RepID=A0AAE3K7H8_9EURY|nr:hypothetical protein [Natronocalculus amylovorans]MCL9816252.1 hypothetical protein [Natronocalculus amylovorans]NUE03342.1 hypothetical protein [Halorubraceae archaeon YAN]